MAFSLSENPLLPILLVVLFASGAHAFGAGNIASISKIEGQNWRHGDIEDTLLTLMMAAAANGGRRKKFDAMSVKRVYFGNWLRDYSQAIDTGALKYVEGGTVRILLWILGFMTFGYATGEFEVTADRLGCYRPEEHIDNPKDYNENQDARSYDRRLRGPVDEATELAIDPQTGMKNYIATEGLTTQGGAPMANSATLVRHLFTRSIELGRSYARSGNEKELYEALRLLGTGLHCIEDFSAHSNYTELALIELGEQSVFPHVGAATAVGCNGRQIWPLVTGTFGGVDFLHSVMGEVNDKAIQSEVEQLEESLYDAQKTSEQNGGEGSILRELMNRFNIGGEEDLSGKAQTLEQKSEQKKQDNQQQSEPWGLGRQADQYARDLYPFLEFHDQIMKAVSETMETMGLSALQEQLAEAASVFVFSLIAPYLLPLLKQVKAELTEGSSEVIASSQQAQHIVFHDAYSSDPTHSMLAKDHFTNCLNEPAGKIASAVVRFAVPLIMDAWDDEGIDPNRVCDEIIGGVFHHPAFVDGSDGRPGVAGRQAMFACVDEWWSSKDEREKQSLRQALSAEGVRSGKNHKGHDTGHGCGKKLHRTKPKKGGGEFLSGNVGESVGKAIEQAVGGGDSSLGGLLGGLAGAALGFGVGGQEEEKKDKKKDKKYKEDKYGEKEYKKKDKYKEDKHEKKKDKYGTSEYGQRTEITPSYGGDRGGYGGDHRQASYQETRSYETKTYSGVDERSSYGGNYEAPRIEYVSPSYGGGDEYGGYRGGGDFPGEDRDREYKQSYGGGGEDEDGYKKKKKKEKENEEKKYKKKRVDDEDEERSRGYGGVGGYGSGGYSEERRYKKGDEDDEDDDYKKKKKKEKEEKKYKKKYDDDDDERNRQYGGHGGYGDEGRRYKKDDDDEDDYKKHYKKKDNDDDEEDDYKKKHYKKKDNDDDDDYKKKKSHGRSSPGYGRRRHYDD